MIDLTRYVFVCALFIAAGAGLLRLMRAPIARGTAVLIGPSLIQALLSCLWALAVVSGVPIKYVVPPVVALLIALGTLGVRSWFVPRAPTTSTTPPAPVTTGTARTALLLAVSLIVPVLVMLPFFIRGLADYAGSGALDGWAYAVLGQYLWDFPRGTEGGLTPALQFASGMGSRRYGASSEMGLFSLLFASGDVESANGLLRAVGVFVFTSACAAFIAVFEGASRISEASRVSESGRRMGVRLPLALLYVAMCGLSGWILDVVWANNYDNTLALSYGPALVALLMLPATLTAASHAVLLGLLVAGAIYTYPELAPMMLGAPAAVAAETVWRRRPSRGLACAGIALLVAVLLLAPSWRDLLWYFDIQLRNGLGLRSVGPGPAPGSGMFPGLLDRQTLMSAWWAMGGELRLFAASAPIRFLACWLFALSGMGVWQLVRRREFALALAWLAHAAAAGWMLWQAHYDYGAYKMLLLGWWLAAFAVVTAVEAAFDVVAAVGLAIDAAGVSDVAAASVAGAAGASGVSHVSGAVGMTGAAGVSHVSGAAGMTGAAGTARSFAHVRPLLQAARGVAWSIGVASLLIVPSVTSVRIASVLREGTPRPISDYHVIDRVPQLIGSAPLALLTEDVQATHWGAYYLRRGNVLLGSRNGYFGMSHVQVRMSRAQAVSPHDVRLIVTDAGAAARAIDTADWKLAWSGGAFAIWDTTGHGWAAVTSVRDPETALGSPRSGFSIQRGATLAVLASDPGELTIAGQVVGETTPNPQCWRMQIRGDVGQSWDLRARPGPVAVTIRVPTGASEISILGSTADPSVHADVALTGITTRFVASLAGANAAGTAAAPTNAADKPAQYQTCEAVVTQE